ncbi:hypothetical protein RRG08_008355 [Elysia crispata]|uniref:Uncharacterized protein n=1 Tax=Elysia crispata TaxID=231223 RepID=A0AAE0YUD4_9GAST|nr:hypothetical protein RRG08_008355 [Elysia crispata]
MIMVTSISIAALCFSGHDYLVRNIPSDQACLSTSGLWSARHCGQRDKPVGFKVCVQPEGSEGVCVYNRKALKVCVYNRKALNVYRSQFWPHYAWWVRVSGRREWSGDRAPDGDLSYGRTMADGFQSLVGGKGGGQAIELQMEISVMAALCLVGSSLW